MRRSVECCCAYVMMSLMLLGIMHLEEWSLNEDQSPPAIVIVGVLPKETSMLSKLQSINPDAAQTFAKLAGSEIVIDDDENRAYARYRMRAAEIVEDVEDDDGPVFRDQNGFLWRYENCTPEQFVTPGTVYNYQLVLTSEDIELHHPNPSEKLTFAPPFWRVVATPVETTLR